MHQPTLTLSYSFFFLSSAVISPLIRLLRSFEEYFSEMTSHVTVSSYAICEKAPMLGRLKASGEGDDRGWDGWMASRTRWTWVWANSGSRWQTGKPGVLQSTGSQNRTWQQLNNNSTAKWWSETPSLCSHSLSDRDMVERRMDINWGGFISSSLARIYHFPLKRAISCVYWSQTAGMSSFGWAPWTLCGLDSCFPS